MALDLYGGGARTPTPSAVRSSAPPAPLNASTAQVTPYAYSAPLAADPAYLQFLRTSGVSQAVAAQDVARKQQALQAALSMRLPQLDQENAISQRNLSGNYESRGMLRSGAYLRDNSELQAQQARGRAGAIADTSNQIADLNNALAQNVAQSQQNAAERALQTGLSQAKVPTA